MKKIKLKNKEEIEVGKIVCVGRNYADHAKEMGNEVPDEFPIIFMKPASTIIYSGDKVEHPDYSNNLQHEVELVLLITETIKNGSEKEAEDAIGGYAVGLDMTLRDLQFQYKDKGEPWTLAKVFDGCAVLSDFVSKEDYKLKENENIYLDVNGERKQTSSLNNMIFDIRKIVSYISKKMTLEKGDLIFTGTPAGVSRVVKGDKIKGGIQNVAEVETEII
ncbi:MAG: fumarylacetoacetate hydrolase family protein [Bacteroidetes bacterium]|nr:fumarylacetoacetate hydrolase family protein [Bacteroidota bacterium]